MTQKPVSTRLQLPKIGREVAQIPKSTWVGLRPHVSCDEWHPMTGRALFGRHYATVMPCFDKKLEASREDFKIFDGPDTGEAPADEGTSEVDCVLTTGEAGPIVRSVSSGS
jgi:hypothetical protein